MKIKALRINMKTKSFVVAGLNEQLLSVTSQVQLCSAETKVHRASVLGIFS